MSETPPRPSSPGLPPLEIPPDIAAVYVNLVRIAHSPAELIFDFAHLLPGSAAAHVKSRLVMSPLGAKLFHRALTENLSRYEAAFGEINMPGSKSLAENLFRPGSSDQPPQE